MLKFVIQKDCAEMRINMEQPIFTREDLKKTDHTADHRADAGFKHRSV